MAYGPFNAGSGSSSGGSASEITYDNSTSKLDASTVQGAIDKIVTLSFTLEAVPSPGGTLTYNGNSLSPTWNNYNPETMEIGGTTSGTNAGTYTATFTPKSGYHWNDGTTDAKSVTWTIERASVSVPSQSGSLAYTGSSQSPSWTGYDSSKMTLSGTTSGTDAGSYTASFTPTDNYKWEDNTTSAKSVTWTISQAAGSLSLSKTSMTLSESSTTGTITVTRAGTGAISAVSSNTSVATVAVSGTTITVTGKKAGSVTITVSVAADTNYTAPGSKTCSVTVNIASSGTSATSGVTYTSGISGIAQANLTRYAQAISNNSNITSTTTTVYIDDGSNNYKLSVGDTVSISVNGTSYDFVILGFNHDTLASSTAYGSTTATGKAGISLQMKDCLATTYAMNSSNTNSGGWGSCALRSTLQSTIKGQLPTAWQNIIKTVTKKASAGSQSTTINSYSDTLFLLAEIEIFGSTSYSVSGEGSQYAYYKAGNSKVKNESGSAYYWWERSPNSSNSTGFCDVSISGYAYTNSASSSLGVAFGFCV